MQTCLKTVVLPGEFRSIHFNSLLHQFDLDACSLPGEALCHCYGGEEWLYKTLAAALEVCQAAVFDHSST